MTRGSPVAHNQAYVTKVMENPNTHPESKAVVVEYVKKHPEKFTIGPYDKPHEIEKATVGFFEKFIRRYE